MDPGASYVSIRRGTPDLRARPLAYCSMRYQRRFTYRFSLPKRSVHTLCTASPQIWCRRRSYVSLPMSTNLCNKTSVSGHAPKRPTRFGRDPIHKSHESRSMPGATEKRSRKSRSGACAAAKETLGTVRRYHPRRCNPDSRPTEHCFGHLGVQSRTIGRATADQKAVNRGPRGVQSRTCEHQGVQPRTSTALPPSKCIRYRHGKPRRPCRNWPHDQTMDRTDAATTLSGDRDGTQPSFD